MANEQKLVGDRVQPLMAWPAKRDEVFHGVVLSITRNAFSQAVNVVNAKLFGRAAFATFAFITLKNGIFIPAKCASGFRSLSVFSAKRAAFSCLNRHPAIFFNLTRLTAMLRASLERVRQPTIRARAHSSDFNCAGFASSRFKSPHIGFGAGDWAAGVAKLLTGRIGFVFRAASFARFLRVSTSRHSARLHLAGAAAFKVATRWLNLDAAIGAIDRPVLLQFCHRQIVHGAFANG